MKPVKTLSILVAVLLSMVLSGCSSGSLSNSSQEQAGPTLIIPTLNTITPLSPAIETDVPKEDSISDTTPNTEHPETVEVTRVPTESTQIEEEDVINYQVGYVLENDVLNVREGPGVTFDIVGELAPGQKGIVAVGSGTVVEDSLWLPIQTELVRGWVNSRFLVEEVDSKEFCSFIGQSTLVNEIITALKNSDADQLQKLVVDMRGLRIRRHWWNPEVLYDYDEIGSLFTSGDERAWGRADGSGKAINGSFVQVIGPLLDRNLIASNEIGCNEILHGGTAGITQLPAEYEGVNFISSYRAPGPDDFEMDWGTWVMGIERWQGSYYLSFMVHCEWEI